MSKIFIDTMGCPKNQEDSERAAGLLLHRGHEIVFSPEEADVIVVNTCGFIDDAKKESIDKILELAQYKDYDSSKKMIVTGCLTQRYGDELYEELKEVDAIMGVNDYSDMPAIVENILNEDDQTRLLKTMGKPDFVKGERVPLYTTHTAYLKIAEGCSNNCSYCIIPKIRGPYRSISMEEVMKDAESLVDKGAKELVLIAQDVSAYGIDVYKEYALAKLLKKLCTIENLKWIRLLYCYEDRITDELIDVIASEDKVCNYIDIPLQHISKNVLSKMNRNSTPEGIKETISKLRQRVPDIAVRTTFITGFPGETEKDFDELRNFVEKEQFDRLGVFSYSKEEGTAAYHMTDQIPSETADGRRDEIMRTQMDISFTKNEKMIGKIYDVLIDEIQDGMCFGRTMYDAPEIDNSVIINIDEEKNKGEDDEINVGDFVRVEIVDAYDYDLIGEIINESTQ